MVATTTVLENYALVTDANRVPTELQRQTVGHDATEAFHRDLPLFQRAVIDGQTEHAP